MMGPKEIHRNVETLRMLNFLLSFLGFLLSIKCHTSNQTNQPH